MKEDVLDQVLTDAEDDFTPVVLGEDTQEPQEETQAEELQKTQENTEEISEEEPEVFEEDPVKPQFKLNINKKYAAIALGCVIAVLAAIYFGGAIYYKNRFFSGTTINGFDCSGLTVEQAQEKLKSDIAGYTYTLVERDKKTEPITGEELAMNLESLGDLNEPKAAQNPFKWCFDKGSKALSVNIIVTIDEAILGAKVASLECVLESAQEMNGATELISYSDGVFSIDAEKEAEDDGRKGLALKYMFPIFPGQQFYAVPNFSKNIVSVSKLTEAIKNGMYALEPSLDLEAAQCYVNIAEENNMQRAIDTMNRYVSAKVDYLHGDEIIPLDCGSINLWVSVDNNYNVYLDEDQVADFVNGIAQKYNTIGTSRTLVTSYGETVSVSGGDYGWKVDVEAETDALCEIIRNGEQTQREPIYSKKAASHGSIDVGNTYVEISIGSQHLWFYKDGGVIVSSDIVSGNPYAGNATPTGIYSLKYKERNATLVGENYRTPVSYWMPFNGGVGMHDANWRGAFGGSIYLGGGSHGCINLPPSVAGQIYGAIDPGTPIVVY
ncbi:MAG: L,D-transpeptidase family protein [Clostridiales bacterium]|nr:L,D-transpeptidase family protein [Clostridiales bacterium]